MLFALLCAVRAPSLTKANRYLRNLLYRTTPLRFSGHERHEEERLRRNVGTKKKHFRLQLCPVARGIFFFLLSVSLPMVADVPGTKGSDRKSRRQEDKRGVEVRRLRDADTPSPPPPRLHFLPQLDSAATGRCPPPHHHHPLSTCSAVSQHLLILSSPQCPLFILLSLLFFFFHLFFFIHVFFTCFFFLLKKRKKKNSVQFFCPQHPLHRRPSPALCRSLRRSAPCV